MSARNGVPPSKGDNQRNYDRNNEGAGTTTNRATGGTAEGGAGRASSRRYVRLPSTPATPATPSAGKSGGADLAANPPPVSPEARTPFADVEPRPDHPTLGGPLYVAGTPPAREDGRAAQEALDRHLSPYLSDQAVGVLEIRLLADNAARGAELARRALEASDAAVRERRGARDAAAAAFCDLAEGIHQSRARVVAEQQKKLDAVDAQIASVERLALLAHARLGVPHRLSIGRASVDAVDGSRLPRTPDGNMAAEATPSEPAAPVAPAPEGAAATKAGAVGRAEPEKENDPADARERSLGLAKMAVGAVFGMAVCSELHLLDLSAARSFEPEELPWLAAAVGLGMGSVHLAHKASFALWSAGGAQAARAAGRWDVLHALTPFVVTLLFVAIEAVVMRNSLVTANALTLPDPANPLHYLSGLVFLAPIAVLGAATGWRAGMRDGERDSARREERQDERSARETARAETAATDQELLQSEAAQWARALDDHLLALYRRRSEIRDEIARLGQAFDDLIGVYRAAYLADPGRTAEEARVLQAAVEDARAAHNAFLAELRRFREEYEPRKNDKDDARRPAVTLHLIRSGGADDRDAAPGAAAPPERATLWARIRAFVGSLLGTRPGGDGGAVTP